MWVRADARGARGAASLSIRTVKRCTEHLKRGRPLKILLAPKRDSDLGLLRPPVLPQPRSSFCGSVARHAGLRLTSPRGGYGCRHGPITDVLTTLSPRALASCGGVGAVLLPALVPLVVSGGFWRARSRHRLDRARAHHCDGQATLGACFVRARAAARRQSGPQDLPIQSHQHTPIRE